MKNPGGTKPPTELAGQETGPSPNVRGGRRWLRQRPATTAPAPVAPHLTSPRNAPDRSSTSAGPAPPAPPGADSGRSCGTSPAAPGCSHRCPRWASAPEGRSGGSARLRAESGTSGQLLPGAMDTGEGIGSNPRARAKWGPPRAPYPQNPHPRC